MLLSVSAYSNVRLPAIFGDHMVLQRESDVKIWGWALPFEKVDIIVPWTDEVYSDSASKDATWEITIPTPKAGGPYVITIKGYNEIVLKDVLIGEVWLCSGQSNMDWSPYAGINNAEELIESGNQPNIRLFQVDKRSSEHPQMDLGGNWRQCTSETMKYFSAIGYVFGTKLSEELDVPIGLINSSWGGSPAEIWIPEENIINDEFLKAGADKIPELSWSPHLPGRSFNAMISPITKFRIAGTIWYQGETNTGNPDHYQLIFEELIKSWRERWTYNFPFYYVQIAPYAYRSPEQGVKVRDAQRRANRIENTGMVVISDIGDTTDIHPKEKIEVGNRLAKMALVKHYRISDQVIEGPLFKSMEVVKNKVQLEFDNDKELEFRDRESLFEVAGEDGKFHEANYSLKNNVITVFSRKVAKPKFIRYAWGNTTLSNLFNAAGLPASSFTTETPFFQNN